MNNNEIKIFENSEFGNVRTIVINEIPYFVGKDVTEALGYTNASKALADHVDKDDKLNNDSLSSLGQRGGWLINESGIYSLVLSSKLPSAKRFKHWVTSEVLPSIRKHGLYAKQELLDDPDLFINLLQDLKKEREENKIKEQKILEMQPKVSYYDIVLQSKDTVTVTHIAKDYGMSAMTFNKKLEELGVQYKQSNTWFLYQEYAEMGYTHSETFVYGDDDNKHTKMNTKWTQKGRLFLYGLLKENGILPLIERD